MDAWSLACPDWRERLKEGRSLVPELPLFQESADRAVAIFNKLRLPDVPGMPSFGEAAGDWFRDIVRALHGSLDPATGARRIRGVFLLVPKKNSKTTNGAGLILTSLLLNRRPRAEFVYVGPTQEVADLALGQTIGMIEADEERVLIGRFRIQEHRKQIIDRVTGARLKIKSWDPKIVTGAKPAGVLIDELHAVPQADADRVVGQLRGGMESQPEAFLVIITTQSERPPAGVFRTELLKARKIRDGEIAGNILPVLYEFPEDMGRGGERAPWRDPRCWPMVLPNLGRSIRLESLVAAYREASDAGEAELVRWCSQHLNIEIGIGLRSDRWVGADLWAQGAEQRLSFRAIVQRCDCVVLGVDGGGLDDLLGLAVLGRERETRRWLNWNKAWAHRSVLERRKSEAGRLRDFATAGELGLVDDLPDDVTAIARFARWIDRRGLLGGVAVDPAGIGAVVEALAEAGIERERIIGVPQGWKLSGAIKTVERKLSDGTFRHAGQGLMAWCVGNAKAEAHGNAVAITKQTAGAGKIDPLVASFIAVALMSADPKPKPFHDGTLISIA